MLKRKTICTAFLLPLTLTGWSLHCTAQKELLTSSLRHPKILIKEFSYFLMPCHQHGLRINLLV